MTPDNLRPRHDPLGALVGTAPEVARATGERQYRYETDCRHGRMAVNRNDLYVGRSLLAYGEWAEFELQLLGPLLRAGDVVVDAGANIGTHTLFFAKVVGPRGHVHAFEPQRHVHAMLCDTLALNRLTDRVTCARAALGSTVGSVSVPYLPTYLILNFGALALGGGVTGDQVPLVTVDSLALPQCRLIKVDVEGMEAEVLRGAEQTIRRHRPILYVENDRPEASAGLVALLRSYGYRLFAHLAPCFNPGNFAGRSENMFPEAANLNLLGLPDDTTYDPTGHPGWDAQPVTMAVLLDRHGLAPKHTLSLNGTDRLVPVGG